MKKIISCFLLLLLTNTCFALDGKYDKLPYNLKTHTVKQHCKTLTISYAVDFHLTRADSRQLYHSLQTYYTQNGTRAGAADIHQYLLAKLKDILTVTQYDRYCQWSNYPEFVFAKEAPVMHL